jgi:ATP-dependent DNA helicase RecG
MDSDKSSADQTQPTVELLLKTPLRFFPKVGVQKASMLGKLGLHRGQDLLFFFPRTYQDIAPFCKVADLTRDTRCSVIGVVDAIDARTFDDGRSSVGVLLAIEGGGFTRMVWYNQPYRRTTFARGMRVIATGVANPTGVSWEMRHPETQILPAGAPAPKGKPLPIYPLTEGLQQRHIYTAVEVVLEKLRSQVVDVFPESFRQDHQLLSIASALEQIHVPETIEQSEQARYRFIFQELFVYQLALATRRYRLQTDRPAPTLPINGQIHARILKRLNLELTNDQKKAVDQIASDMGSVIPMNRLVQGDVGSGKTVVALYAMLLAVAHGYQATFMAPTEILAQQHAQRLQSSLEGSSCAVELLTGGMGGREKSDLLERIALGTVDIVVGTQALLSEHVSFSKLGIAVIDEQHKFGVEQRAALCSSRIQPHYLVLSATPIPRTLTMTAMGDLDVTILRDKPPGRAPVHTYLGKPEQQASWWAFVAKSVAQGRQAYVVTPRVSVDEDESEAAGATQTWNHLKDGPLKGLRLELLHGRMTPEEKKQKLTAFSNGEIDVLVTTTVVEVGIDVANATVMTILDADRLGLAQLHQLRGRISRSSHPGYLCVFASPGVSAEENTRLAALASTNDGFELAEQDWRLRGPGNLLGTSQSGLPPFRIADLQRDSDLVSITHKIARDIIASDPLLEADGWSLIRQQVFGKYGMKLELGSVG